MTKSKNLLKSDPSRTITLRNKAVREVNRRYSKISQLITKSVAKNKIFVNIEPLDKSDFVFIRDPQKLAAFDAWLHSAISEIVLSGGVVPGAADLNWLLVYFEESYSRGVRRTNNNMARLLGRNVVPVRSRAFDTPFHIQKLEFLFSRDFAQLKGITETMSQQITKELSDSLLKGESPLKAAKKMNDRVDKIGKTRSKLLARTEIINTHNLGSIYEGEDLEALIGEEVVYFWDAAEDSRVRREHNFRDEKYYSRGKVATLIGEPNCRCAVTGVPISMVPEGVEVIR